MQICPGAVANVLTAVSEVCAATKLWTLRQSEEKKKK